MAFAVVVLAEVVVGCDRWGQATVLHDAAVLTLLRRVRRQVSICVVLLLCYIDRRYWWSVSPYDLCLLLQEVLDCGRHG